MRKTTKTSAPPTIDSESKHYLQGFGDGWYLARTALSPSYEYQGHSDSQKTINAVVKKTE